MMAQRHSGVTRTEQWQHVSYRLVWSWLWCPLVAQLLVRERFALASSLQVSAASSSPRTVPAGLRRPRLLSKRQLHKSVCRSWWSPSTGRTVLAAFWQIKWTLITRAAEGQRLAARIIALRVQRPDYDVYLVGHSAGCTVVLSAAENLPADAVKRIVLLAPSVSADYDLRRALRSSRNGIDVFFSGRDYYYLGIGVALTGTADRRWTSPAAGRTGFRPLVENCYDAALYQKLHQHGWDPCVEWTGNRGGHYDGYKPDYLRSYVLPLFD